jgi:hypothetical protein
MMCVDPAAPGADSSVAEPHEIHEARFDGLATCFSRLEMTPPSWEALRLAMAIGAELTARECRFRPELEIRGDHGSLLATLRRLDFSADSWTFRPDCGFGNVPLFVAAFLKLPPRKD